MAAKDKEIEAYKAYFDLWIKTREERAANNRYFLTLLFIDTLVGIFTAVLGATKETAFPDLTRTLLLVTLLAAVVISIVWGCKIFALNIVEGSQQDVLKEIELQLGLKKVTATFYNRELKGTFLGMELFQKRQEAEAHKNWFYAWFWWASFWALPILFVVLFAGLSIYLYTHPSAIPLPNPAVLQNVSANATHNASVNASLIAQ